MGVRDYVWRHSTLVDITINSYTAKHQHTGYNTFTHMQCCSLCDYDAVE